MIFPFQIDDCRDLSSLFYLLPFQRGFLVNWDHQKTVLDYIFGKNCLNVNTETRDIVFTEPYFNFNSIQARKRVLGTFSLLNFIQENLSFVWKEKMKC